MNKNETDSHWQGYISREEITADELRLVLNAFREDRDWASQPRAVYTGESMERELDELFPVEVGLQALMEKFESEGKIEAAKKVEERLRVMKEEFVAKGRGEMVQKIDAILQERSSRTNSTISESE